MSFIGEHIVLLGCVRNVIVLSSIYGFMLYLCNIRIMYTFIQCMQSLLLNGIGSW